MRTKTDDSKYESRYILTRYKSPSTFSGQFGCLLYRIIYSRCWEQLRIMESKHKPLLHDRRRGSEVLRVLNSATAYPTGRPRPRQLNQRASQAHEPCCAM